MAKILLTADIHFGLNGKLEDCIWAMNMMANYAKNNQIDTIIILGDLFHDRVNIQINVLSEVHKYFKQHQDIRFITYCGNHDMFLKTSWDINSLEPLSELITVISNISFEEIYGQRFWFLPFMHFEDQYIQTLSDVETKNDVSQDILLTHIGVNNASLNECFLLKHWSSVNFTKSTFKRIYTGHFHCHQQVGDNCWYPGSPIPFRFDEGLVEHGFLVFDTDTQQHEFIKIFEIGKIYSQYRPADYITIIDKDLPKNIDWVTGNHVRIILSRSYSSNERAQIKTVLQQKGAKTVNLMQSEKKILEAKIISQQKKVNTPEALFSTYIDIDKPKLDIPLLMSLHKTIVQEAEERFVAEPDDAEA